MRFETSDLEQHRGFDSRMLKKSDTRLSAHPETSDNHVFRKPGSHRVRFSENQHFRLIGNQNSWKPKIPKILKFRFVKVDAFGHRTFVHQYLFIFLSSRILHSAMGLTDYNKNQCNGRHLLSRTSTHCINASTGDMQACCQLQWCTPCRHVP